MGQRFLLAYHSSAARSLSHSSSACWRHASMMRHVFIASSRSALSAAISASSSTMVDTQRIPLSLDCGDLLHGVCVVIRLVVPCAHLWLNQERHRVQSPLFSSS